MSGSINGGLRAYLDLVALQTSAELNERFREADNFRKLLSCRNRTVVLEFGTAFAGRQLGVWAVNVAYEAECSAINV